MRTSALFLLLLFGFDNACFGQESMTLPKFKGEILVVRCIEQTGTLLRDGIFVSDGLGNNYEIELPALKAKNQPEALAKIVQVLAEVKKQGYRLESSNCGGASSAALLITNYVFHKE